MTKLEAYKILIHGGCTLDEAKIILDTLLTGMEAGKPDADIFYEVGINLGMTPDEAAQARDEVMEKRRLRQSTTE